MITNQSHESSMARWHRLVDVRQAFVENQIDTSALHSCIAETFNRDADTEVDERLSKVEELIIVKRQMEDRKLNVSTVQTAIATLFSSDSHNSFENSMKRWEDLKGARDQMTAWNINTSGIDTVIESLFNPDLEGQERPPSQNPPVTPSSSRSPTFVSGHSAQISHAKESSQQSQRTTANPPAKANVQSEFKPDFWSRETCFTSIPLWSVRKGDTSVTGPGLHLRPNFDTEMIVCCRDVGYQQLFRSTLEFPPKAIMRILRAREDHWARLVLSDEGSVVDLRFLVVRDFEELVEQLRRLREIDVEYVDKEEMNQMMQQMPVQKANTMHDKDGSPLGPASKRRKANKPLDSSAEGSDNDGSPRRSDRRLPHVNYNLKDGFDRLLR
ncbi:hypothetical protein ACLMJK_001761 [Lecanora helva]